MKDFLQKIINFLFQKNINIPYFIILALGLFVIFVLIIAIVFGVSLSNTSKQNEKLKKDLLSLQNQIQQSNRTTSTYQSPQSQPSETLTTTETQTTTSPTTTTTTNTENTTSTQDPEKQKVLYTSKTWIAQYYPDKSQNASYAIQSYDWKNASVFVNGPYISMTLQLIKRLDTNEWTVYSPTPPSSH